VPEAPESFETVRLRAERVRPEHLELFHSLREDARVADWLGGTKTRAESEAGLAIELEHWRLEGFGLWAWFERETGDFVGRAGLRRREVEGRVEFEVAYALAAKWWGQGLATEMAEALIRIAFEELAFDDLVAYTLHDNIRSRRVMEKAGLTYERDIVHQGVAQVLYRIRRGSSNDG
jgi:ribosomal-protein-alanine N-acetyltransferase